MLPCSISTPTPTISIFDLALILLREDNGIVRLCRLT
ncbi:hypothetical protein LINGRAHAP2_LOCUS27897 [Linum grandiflorum]